MIAVASLSRWYDGVRALEDVSFEIASGAALAVVGPSGSGKTTLLRLIAGLELPDSGEVLLDGRAASRPGWALAPHRRGVGFVFQSPALWPHMTVAQNILFGLRGLPHAEARARLEALLDQTGLKGLERRYPHQISGGQARRVALARALAPRPRFLLLDEPLTNLDTRLKEEMLELILAAARHTAATLLYVTHQMDEATRVARRVLRLEAGLVAGVDEL
jgi:iron(III) transport system ATP-binding protein